MSEQASEPDVESMYRLHVEIGRQAAQLALSVLQNADPADIPIAAAVQLLKFGVELERKSVLGVDESGDEADPFDEIVQGLLGQQRKEGEGESD